MMNVANTAALQELIDIVARLRDPISGCPWDLAQTQESLTPYIVEEAYETVHAIRSGQQAAITEELGDLLLQVVLQSQLAQEAGYFSIAEVAQGISQKLVRRHPHVFGDTEVSSIGEVRANWEEIKAQEKGTSRDLPSQKISKYAEILPPLTAAIKVSQAATKFGFEWKQVEDVWAKFQEELGEFREALQSTDKAHQEAELGDLLFTIVNLARWYQLDPERGLQGTLNRFSQRLAQMEKMLAAQSDPRSNRSFTDFSLEELEVLWQKAKGILEAEKSKG
jgi:XTP/dITP diphosphohydrolase